MTPSSREVDAAVRSALAELGHGPKVEAFAGRLLALRHAEAFGPNLKEVRLAPGTVVTPLAKDHLKRLGIALRWVSDAEINRAPSEGEWGFATESDSGIVVALRRALLDAPKRWIEVVGSASDVAHWVVARPGRGAALLTPEASLATWVANRVEGVRAATVGEAEAIGRAARVLGANLVVIEPAGKSISWLKHLLETFRRAGAPRPPDDLRRRHEDRRGDRPSHVVPGPPQPAERALRDRLADAARGLGRGLPPPR
jgi:hypothetical protein